MVVSLAKCREVRGTGESLSDLEWRVVNVAGTNGPRSLDPEGIVSQLFRLFGLRVARPLVDKRLEALRRFSVRAWYWDVIRLSDMHALYAAGYSTSHAQQVLAHVAAARGFAPSIQEKPHVARHVRSVG